MSFDLDRFCAHSRHRVCALVDAGGVDRADYFDSKSGWDLKGLESDLNLCEVSDVTTTNEPETSYEAASDEPAVSA